MTKNIIFSTPLGRNGDGELALRKLCLDHIQGIVNLEVVIVIGQPLLKRAALAQMILAQYGLDTQVQIALGSPMTSNVIWDESQTLDPANIEFESAHNTLLKILNPFNNGKRYTFVATAGLNELQYFLTHYYNQVLEWIEEVVVFSGVQECKLDSSETMLDNSTNNMLLKADELGWLALLQNNGVLKQNRIPVTIITKHYAKSISFDKSEIDTITRQSLRKTIQSSLELFYAIVRLDSRDPYRNQFLPSAVTTKSFWEQFTTAGKELALSPFAKVWTYIERICFYDVYCLFCLTHPEHMESSMINIIDPCSGHISEVKVVGCPGFQSTSTFIREEILKLLTNL
jgi:hypothetical protein